MQRAKKCYITTGLVLGTSAARFRGWFSRWHRGPQTNDRSCTHSEFGARGALAGSTPAGREASTPDGPPGARPSPVGGVGPCGKGPRRRIKGSPFPSLPQPPQQGDEGLRVALRSAPQAITLLDRGNPPEDVEPFLMFVERGDTNRLSPWCPGAAEMKGEIKCPKCEITFA